MDSLPKSLDPKEWAIAKDGLLARRVGSWAEEKLFYLARYIDIFNKGMQYKWPRRAYIELFAASGRVMMDDERELDGSAMLALNTEVPFTHHFFNDLEPLAIDSLKRRVGDTAALVAYETRDCNDAARLFRSKLPPDSLDLLFIDPTNWQIQFDTIVELTKGRRMDLVMTFHVGGMKRAVDSAPRSLDDFFGTSDWKSAYQASLSAGLRQGGRILLDCYEQQLRKIGYEWVVDDLTIRNTKNVSLYHLIFASKNPRGEDFSKKISQRTSGGQLRWRFVTNPPLT